MHVLNMFERRIFEDDRYVEKDDAELSIDDADGKITFHLRTRNVGRPDIVENRSVTGEISSDDLQRDHVKYMIDIIENWLASETRSSIAVKIGDIPGIYGPYGDRERFSGLEMAVEPRGIWLIPNIANARGVHIPAATEQTNGDDDNIYNIVRFKQVLEECIYEYGTKQEKEPSDTGFLSLPDSSLDNELRQRCIRRFNQGDYPGAAKEAGQLLEERVREQGPDTSALDHGSSLMTEMFSPKDGPLSFGEIDSEREGILHLYTGAIKGIWNPLHHRTPDPS